MALAWPVSAHHSFSAEFDSNKSVTLAGEVVMMEWVNPHSWLHIDVKKPDGSVERWKIEGGSPSVLMRLGWNRNSLPAGTRVTVVGFQAKDGSLRASSRSLMFPDGRRMDLGGSGSAAQDPKSRAGLYSGIRRAGSESRVGRDFSPALDASYAEALMKQLVMLVAVLAFARAAAGQNADDYRGGWRTDNGEAHTYEFSIRGATVRGVYCTYCADATTLGFVDGTFGPDGIVFEVTHVNADGSTAYKDKAIAKFSKGRLIVTGTSGAPGGGRFERVLIKDPRGPDPIPAMVSVLPKGPPVPANPLRRNPDGADGLPYIQPGPWKSKLAEKDVVGVWLGFGVGAPKQFFIIKKVGNKLRGMVCGTCDNPYTMAALDDFRIEGDTLKFNILHEDWGDGEIPTFDKHVTAHVGWNEMRCTTAADHQPPHRPRSRRAVCLDSRCRVRFRLRPHPATSGPNGPRRAHRRPVSKRSYCLRLKALLLEERPSHNSLLPPAIAQDVLKGQEAQPR